MGTLGRRIGATLSLLLLWAALTGWMGGRHVLASATVESSRAEAFSCADMARVNITGNLGESVPAIPVSECEALVQFYQALGGDSWNQPSYQWFASNNPCRWLGVECKSQHVVRIDLTNRNLSGPLPGAALAALPELFALGLGENKITGAIPSQLADMPNLAFLSLDQNQLTGPIPERLLGDANPDIISYGAHGLLNLGDNNLSGTLPLDLGRPKLALAWFSNNPGLTGRIPESWQSMSQLNSVRADGTGLCLPRDWNSDIRVGGAPPCAALLLEPVGTEIKVCRPAASSSGLAQDLPCASPKNVAPGERWELDHGSYLEFPSSSGATATGARLLLDCDRASLVQLAFLFTDPVRDTDPYRAQVLMAFLIAAGLENKVCAGDASAAQFEAVAGGADLILQLEQGAITADIEEQTLVLQMETDTASISASEGNRFLVGHDPESGQTLVVAHDGTLQITSTNANGDSFALEPGQRATLSTDQPVQIADFGTVYLPSLQR